MRLQGDLEREIYAAAFVARLNALVDRGYPEAWRASDRDAGRDHARIHDWQAWCADLAVQSGSETVLAHREALKRRGHVDGRGREVG